MPTSPDPLAVCEEAARAGGRVLDEWVGRFTATTKGPRDFVTEADRAAQAEIRRVVLTAFPSHGFVGEEGDESGLPLPPGTPGHAGSGTRWIVDPLDGTTNYVHGFPAYCVSVALAEGDDLVTAPSEAVAAISLPANVLASSPAIADLLAAVPHVHSVRRTGSTALNLAYLACGRLHTFWVRRIACWDAAAGILIAREAGCAVGSFARGPATIPLDDPAFIAASTPELLAAMRDLLG
jgi:myo-inositol-1(or 4)-monophosphatase